MYEKWKKYLQDFEQWYAKVGVREKTFKGWDWGWDWALIKTISRVKRGKCVLDVGCGCGWFLVHAIKLGCIIGIGIDPSKKELKDAIELARINTVNEKEHLILGVGEGIPIKGGYFDVVVCIATLDHTLFPDKVIAEIRRVLKTKGRLVILSGFSYVKSPIYSKLMRVLPSLQRSTMDHHTYAFGFNELNILLEHHGFKLENYQTYGFLLPFIPAYILHRFTSCLSNKAPQFANAILAVYKTVK